MGVYRLGKSELKDAVKDALDDIEGDFTRQELKDALAEVGREYKYVCDEP